MRLEILKRQRKLTLFMENGERFSFPIALGKQPVSPKEREGDGKTPEGEYFVCLKKMGKYGPSLGVSYPGSKDALALGADQRLLFLIQEAEKNKTRPPWGSFMGGEIYIHGGGTLSDWTQGCIALSDEDAKKLYDLVPLGTPILIFP